MMMPANNNSPNSTNTNTSTPLHPTRLTNAIRSSVASSITKNHQTRRGKIGRDTRYNNTNPESENEVIEHYERLDVDPDVDGDDDNDKSDGELEPDEDGLDIEDGADNNNVLDFITETNLKESQLEREQTTENAAPKEFGFENYWQFRDGTVLDKELVPTTMPEGWKPKAPRENEPEFKDILNPGNWSPFVFRPYPWTGKYKHHRLSSEAVPVP